MPMVPDLALVVPDLALIFPHPAGEGDLGIELGLENDLLTAASFA